jgi:hypothetical protein
MRPVALAGMLAAFLFLAPATAYGAAGDIVELVGGATIEVRVDGSSSTFSVPIKSVEGVDPGEIKTTVLGVSVDNQQQAGLDQRFFVNATRSEVPRIGFILVTLKLAPPLKPGTYGLLLQLTHAKLLQTLALHIVVPPATLRALQVVRAKVVDRLWPFHDVLTDAELVLAERSDKAQLSRISITSVDAQSDDGSPSSGKLQPKNGVRVIDGEFVGSFTVDDPPRHPHGH